MADKRATSLLILPSASRDDTNTQDFKNDQFVGGDFFVDQTVQGSTLAFVSVKLQSKIPGTTKYWTVGTVSPSTTATFQKVLSVSPGNSTFLEGETTGITGTLINGYLPGIWRISSTNISTSAVTFSVSANLYA